MLWQTKATNLCCQTANEWCRIDTLVCVSIWGPSAPTEVQEEEEEEEGTSLASKASNLNYTTPQITLLRH